MSSEIEIVNMALGHLGQPAVTSLSPDVGKVALNKLLPFKEPAREWVLKAHDWNEARQELNLTPLSLTGNMGPYAYAYGLPDDVVRIGQVSFGYGGGNIQWRRGTHVNNAGARQPVLYAQSAISAAGVIVKLPWDQMSVHLAMAVSLKMAELACYIVTSDRRREDTLREKYMLAMAEAGVAEAFETGDEPECNPLLNSFGGLRATAL